MPTWNDEIVSSVNSSCSNLVTSTATTATNLGTWFYPSQSQWQGQIQQGQLSQAFFQEKVTNKALSLLESLRKEVKEWIGDINV